MVVCLHAYLAHLMLDRFLKMNAMKIAENKVLRYRESTKKQLQLKYMGKSKKDDLFYEGIKKRAVLKELHGLNTKVF